MKAIVIHVGDVQSAVGEKLVGISVVDKMEVAATWPARPDALAGMLSSAYIAMAQTFLDTHPGDCLECPAYRFHNAQVLRTRVLLKEITGEQHP